MYIYLLAHAEVGEDFGEDVVGGDGAGDFAEPVEAFADVLVKEITAEAAIQARDGAGNGIAGMRQGLVVAGISNDDCIIVHFGQRGVLDDEVAQELDVGITFSTDGHDWRALRKKVI